jgi:small subunit ribosomal protein S8
VVPRSKIKLELVKILKQEGFIEGFIDVPEGPQGQIKIFLRYDAANRGVIRGLDRVSKPGCRKYVGRDEIPRVRNGLGLAILTTPKGVLTGQQALHAGVGGELLCYVW